MMDRRLKASLLLSVFFHLALVIFMVTAEFKRPDPVSQPIEFTIVDPNMSTDEALRRAMQIVDQSEKSINDEKTDDAKFLSRHNQKVVEETRAAKAGRFQNDAGQGLAQQGKFQPQQNKDAKKQAQKKSGDKKPDPFAHLETKTDNGLPTLEALKPKFNWDKMGGGERATASVERPGLESQTDDYLKNVKTGVQTLLNTREFVYFSYYNRIKNQLAQYWEPKIKEKVMHMFRRGRKIASDQDRITRLRITLDSKGILIGVAVVGESGVTELDDAAIEAFRAAAPFPNPPKGIVESDGTIKIDWSFILEANNFRPLEVEEDMSQPRRRQARF